MAALQEERKTYDQLAEECGYSARYVKQDVAPKLWLLISQAVGDKVNKANVRAALEAAMRNRAISQLSNRSTASDDSFQSRYISGQYTEKEGRELVEGEEIIAVNKRNSNEAAAFHSLYRIDSQLAFPPEASKANILLVDDQPQNLKLLSDLLEEQGYEVQQAINGAIAYQAIQTSPPDLVLLDIHMPQMDGYTLCQHIKTNPETSDIPVIFVSAIDEAWDKVKAFSAGGCDYITKPFKVVEVLARVDNHLKIQQLQRTLIAQNIKLQQAIRELQRLAAIDEITQVASRRRFDAYLLDCWQQASRRHLPLTLMLVQIDNFSFYGEIDNPQLGDHALRSVAQMIQQTTPGDLDLVARYGTLTFAVVLPQQTQAEGSAIAQELLEKSQKKPLSKEITQESLQPPLQTAELTLSIGIVSIDFLSKEPSYLGIGEFLAASERTLQEAKQSGNCIVYI